MIPIARTLLGIAVLVFPVTSMFVVGCGHTLQELSGPLRRPRRVGRALLANFVLVPLLAFALSRVLGLDAALGAGLMLVGTAAGAPFLVKLTQAARGDLALAAALILLLMPATVVYMPLVVPWVVADAAVSVAAVAVPLLLTLILPLILGLVLRAKVPGWAKRLGPWASVLSTVSLLVLIACTLIASHPQLEALLGTGAIAGAILLIAGAFLIGYTIAVPSGRTVLGLGSAQRNIAAAMVVATDFQDTRVLTMVVVVSVVDLLVLFPIAALLRRRAHRREAPPPRHPGAQPI